MKAGNSYFVITRQTVAVAHLPWANRTLQQVVSADAGTQTQAGNGLSTVELDPTNVRKKHFSTFSELDFSGLAVAV